MLSLQHKFLFVHIPKTGGNSIQKVLESYSEDQITTHQPFQDGKERFGIQNPQFAYHKHSTLLEYKQLIPRDMYAPLTKFTVVRNPWDRMVSLYFSPHSGRTKFDPNLFESVIKQAKPIEDYVSTSSWIKKITQKNPLQKTEIDHFIKFENLQEEFTEVSNKLGLDVVPLKKLNASERADFRSYYTPKLKELVQNKFKNEQDFFEYEF